jgi:hypothetical protein
MLLAYSFNHFWKVREAVFAAQGSSPLVTFFVHLEGLLFQVKVARLLAEYKSP